LKLKNIGYMQHGQHVIYKGSAGNIAPGAVLEVADELAQHLLKTFPGAFEPVVEPRVAEPARAAKVGRRG